MTVTLDTPLRRSDDVLYTPVGSDRGVFLNMKANRYHSLNAVGARAWELLETPQTLAQLCERITDEFDVDAATCQTAMTEFVGQLMERGILHVDPA
ncbi:MAG: PqqD family protein [Rhizomicrobium sp.]